MEATLTYPTKAARQRALEDVKKRFSNYRENGVANQIEARLRAKRDAGVDSERAWSDTLWMVRRTELRHWGAKHDDQLSGLGCDDLIAQIHELRAEYEVVKAAPVVAPVKVKTAEEQKAEALVPILIAGLEHIKADIAADFVSYTTRRVERFLAKHLTEVTDWQGNVRIGFPRNFYNTEPSREWATIRDFVIQPEYSISEKAISRAAESYAERVFSSMIGKLAEKLFAIDHVDGIRMHGHDQFELYATMGDKEIRVEQQRIINWSSLGTPFHQWPARIYVDRQFISEAEFKKLAA